ncbi:hypothetical protein BH09MYX1_BH09MYX1_60240 [soil metagenome]
MRTFFLASSVASFVVLSGCSTPPGGRFDGGTGGDVDGGTIFPGDDGGDPFGDANGGETSGPAECNPSPDNFEVAGNNCDDDGDGTIDNVATACDTGLQATGDANAFAKAIGLCKGVVSAAFTQGYQSATPPSPNQHGILPKFGNVIKPQEGATLGVLSSGFAREYNGLSGTTAFRGFTGTMTGKGAAPPGYPKASPSCPNATIDNTVQDVSTLKLSVKVPANAKGISFNFNFYSGEWPEFVCTQFNDSFIAYLKSNAFNNGKADNISFDANKNPVSVNNGFFDRCSPKTLSCSNFPSGYKACGSGDAELQGTGFYALAAHCGGGQDSGGGATGWLQTKAPVQPGETITIEFMIWDTGDQAWNSSVLIDGWQWEATDTTVGTVRGPN